jgi:hypothetical protein
MSNTTRNGKIARLPKAIREELNQRLEDGETGAALVAWLNGLPEIQALVESQFGGHPILEQNLSQWKQGGYEDWRNDQKAMELAERLYERDQEMQQQAQERPPMSAVLSRWLGSRYAVSTRQIEQTEGPEGWRMLRQMCGDVGRLRRMEQQDRRLEIEQQRVEIERKKVELDEKRFAAEQRALKAKRRSKDKENEDAQEKEPKQHWSEILGISKWKPYVPSAAAEPPVADPVPEEE